MIYLSQKSLLKIVALTQMEYHPSISLICIHVAWSENISVKNLVGNRKHQLQVICVIEMFAWTLTANCCQQNGTFVLYTPVPR